MPQSSLTPSALMELDLAVGVFERGATSSLRARQGLVSTHEYLTIAYADLRPDVAYPAEAS